METIQFRFAVCNVDVVDDDDDDDDDDDTRFVKCFAREQNRMLPFADQSAHACTLKMDAARGGHHERWHLSTKLHVSHC